MTARTWMDYCLGMYYTRQRRFNEAEPYINRAFTSHRGEGEMPAAVLGGLAYIAFMRGKLHQAEEILQRALGIANRVDTSADIYTTLGMIYYQRNNLEGAVVEWKRACAPFAVPSAKGLAWLYLAGTNLIKGDIKTAGEAIEKAEKTLNTDDISAEDLARISAFHLSVALQENDEEAISHWLDKLAEYEGPFLYDVPANSRHLLYQTLGCAGGNQLQSEYECYRKEGYRYLEMGVQLERALLSPDPQEALSFLGGVLTTARGEDNIRIIADAGPLVVPLLREAIATGIEPSFGGNVLNIIKDEEHQRKVSRGELPSVSSLLSEREMEVLRLMADGLSNPEIATRLVLSVNTVKSHVRRVLAKLETDGRVQAITRAKELKLL